MSGLLALVVLCEAGHEGVQVMRVHCRQQPIHDLTHVHLRHSTPAQCLNRGAAATSLGLRRTSAAPTGRSGARYSGFCQTEMWLRLVLVKGSRFQSLHRSRKAIPARRAMRSNSDGHTLRNGAEKVLVSPSKNQ